MMKKNWRVRFLAVLLAFFLMVPNIAVPSVYAMNLDETFVTESDTEEQETEIESSASGENLAETEAAAETETSVGETIVETDSSVSEE
ncbi:MAG: hypothetical protein ACI4C1_10940, partial [Lachnospiraceae bacterium]